MIGRIQCGDPVLIIDQHFGSPHIRTEDGTDGYIIGLNLGQWSLQPEAQRLNNAPTPNVVQPKAAAPTAVIIRTPRSQTIPDGNNG